MIRFVLPLMSLLLVAAAPARTPPAQEASLPVVMQPRPGTALETTARQLVAQDLGEARAAGERPLVLLGTVRLGAKASDPAALFVQLQSARECGSAGCSTQVYLPQGGRWTKVLDGAEGRLAVSSRRTRGMADILADGDRFVWTGSAYRDTRPSPAVDLRPRR